MRPQPGKFKHQPKFARVFKIRGRTLSGGTWTALRNAFLRFSPFCAHCGHVGEEIHHKIPRSVRPDLVYEWDNLQTLCKECHRVVHSNNDAKR